MKILKTLGNTILGMYIVFVISLNILSPAPANSQILPENFESSPGVDFNRASHPYGWCVEEIDVANNNEIYSCAYATAYSLPSQKDIDEYRTRITSPTTDPYGTPTTISDMEAASSPQDYLKRVCYTRLYGGSFRYIYRDGYYGNTTLEPNKSNLIVLNRKDNYIYSTKLPQLIDNQKWNTCKLKPASQLSCNFNATDITKAAFASKFPLDIFENLEGNIFESPCPKIVIRGVEMELCYLKDLTKGLKYVILILFILNSIAWL